MTRRVRDTQHPSFATLTLALASLQVFIAMAKALDFIDPDKLSMTVILTAMNRFLNETNGLQMAFLDGNQPQRLCEPMRQYIEARGGEVRLSSPLRRVELNADGTVSGLRMAGKDGQDGEVITADFYVSVRVRPPCAVSLALTMRCSPLPGHAGGPAQVDAAACLGGDALFCADAGAGGHPGDQHPPLVRP